MSARFLPSAGGVPTALLALAVAVPPAAVAAEPAAAPATAIIEAPQPPLGEPREFRLPQKVEYRLPNGVGVTLVPFGAVPKVTVTVVVRTGNVDDPVTGLADVVAEMLTQGAGDADAATLARRAAEMGGALGVGASADQTTASLDVLAERLPEAVAMLADVVRRPALPESELPRIRANFARQIAVARSQPQTAAAEAYAKLLWGGHPYGRALPSEADVASYTIDQVRAFHAANFGAARAHVYVAGRFDRAVAERAIAASFGDWAAGSPPTVNVPTGTAAMRVRLIDRPGAAQSTIFLGLPAPDPTAPDYLPLVVANALLGGSLVSRLDQNLREKHGWTYGANSFLTPYYRAGSWTATADVNTPDTAPALRELLGEIQRLRREPPPPEELRAIQNYRSGTFTLGMASRTSLLGQLAFLDLHGLPDDWLATYVQRIYAVTPADVQAAARRHLDPSAMTLVVVGDLAEVGPAIRGLPALKGARFE